MPNNTNNMKKLFYLLLPVLVLAACHGAPDKATQLAELKKQRAELDTKIKELEAGAPADSGKSKPVSITVVQPADFHAYVEVQSAINGDDNILATPKAPGTVKSINVVAGRHVGAGEILATLDASAIEQQIEAMMPQLTLTKSVYEKQQNLWSQNIGTEVQLMTAKAQYESVQKQISALQTQKDMYRIVSPISGTVDAVNLKVGDFASPGMSGIKVVNTEKLKAEANVGQNYLGKIRQGDPVTLIFPDISDTIRTTLTHVSQAVDPISRAFTAQVVLGQNPKLHPNMSCIMRISNYENPKALVVPVSVIQKTQNGTMVYIVKDGKAQSVLVTTGQNSNGQVEITSGLHAGDQVVTTGYEELDDNERVSVQ